MTSQGPRLPIHDVGPRVYRAVQDLEQYVRHRPAIDQPTAADSSATKEQQP